MIVVLLLMHCILSYATQVKNRPDLGIFRADYLAVGHVRTDPIISQTCLSDHVHTFYGPPLLFPNVTDQDLRESDPDKSSGNIRENRSLYWHPSVYRIEDDGTRTLLEPFWTDVYYTYEVGETIAFPNGFRMIAGYEEGDATVDCENRKSCKRDDCDRVNDFFPKNRCDEIKISMALPRCWDGINLDSSDHMSHVVYPKGDEPFEGKCPNSHPKRLPFLEIDIRYRNYQGGPHEFSDGSGLFHTDYMSGWDSDFLQSVLDNCNQDASEELCKKVPFTWRDDIIDPFDEEVLVDLLHANPVPPAKTECITDEKITDILELPRGTCTGTVKSVNGDCFTSCANGDCVTSCANDPTFMYQDKKKKTCVWIGNKEKRRKKLCVKPAVKEACLMTCGSCCEDDDTFTFQTKTGKTKDCDWVKQNAGRIKRFCRESKVRANCPVACDFCKNTGTVRHGRDSIFNL